MNSDSAPWSWLILINFISRRIHVCMQCSGLFVMIVRFASNLLYPQEMNTWTNNM